MLVETIVYDGTHPLCLLQQKIMDIVKIQSILSHSLKKKMDRTSLKEHPRWHSAPSTTRIRQVVMETDLFFYLFKKKVTMFPKEYSTADFFRGLPI